MPLKRRKLTGKSGHGFATLGGCGHQAKTFLNSRASTQPPPLSLICPRGMEDDLFNDDMQTRHYITKEAVFHFGQV